jgi:hypothetical protein
MWIRRVWLDRESCLPLGVVSEGRKGPRDEPDPGASGPEFIRHEATFLDRRLTSGFRVPYRIEYLDRTGRPYTRWKIEQFEMNKVDPDLFRHPAR